MRIISGTLGGRRLNPPANLPVRPTTDLAKTALFNILENTFDLSEIKALDLFSGTGNIAYELASRGCVDITAVDRHPNCCRYIKETINQLKINGCEVIQTDVFKYLNYCSSSFDLIFADPPYDLDRLQELPQLILSKNLLKEEGRLIIEHPSSMDLRYEERLLEKRVYGQSAFSFFR